MKNGLPAAARCTSAARAPALAPRRLRPEPRRPIVQAPDGEPLDEVVAAQVGDEVGEVLVVAGVDAARRAEDEDARQARCGAARG